MKYVLIVLAKSVLIPLGLAAVEWTVDEEIHKKLLYPVVVESLVWDWEGQH